MALIEKLKDLIKEQKRIAEGNLIKNPYSDFNAGILDIIEDLQELINEEENTYTEDDVRVAFEAGRCYENRESNIYVDEYIKSLKK